MSLIHPGEQGSGPAFRFAGIPIQVRWTFFLFTVLFGSSLEKPTLIVSVKGAGYAWRLAR